MRIVAEDRPRLWPWLGAIAGFGLLTKHTLLFFGLGLVPALALTPARKYFGSRWLYAGGLVAFVVFLPNLIWQIQNGWPTVEFLRALNAGMPRVYIITIPDANHTTMITLIGMPMYRCSWMMSSARCHRRSVSRSLSSSKSWRMPSSLRLSRTLRMQLVRSRNESPTAS